MRQIYDPEIVAQVEADLVEEVARQRAERTPEPPSREFEEFEPWSWRGILLVLATFGFPLFLIVLFLQDAADGVLRDPGEGSVVERRRVGSIFVIEDSVGNDIAVFTVAGTT